VTVAACGGAFELLKKECPDCSHMYLEDYPAPYSSTKYFLPKFFANIPKLLQYLAKEKKMFNSVLAKNKYDLIISDNRLGIYSKEIPSVFITHQLRFSVPYYIRPLETVSEYVNAYLYADFDRIVVPSNKPGANCISGKLCKSERKIMNEKAYYSGILSTARKLNVAQNLDYLFIISGPEPQRTKLERIILEQAGNLSGKKIVLLGKPKENFEKHPDADTVVKSYVSDTEKNMLMNRAKFIISRSGYTTMMDIAELGKTRGLFISTPGQTEQEYLSDYYEKKGWFFSKNQYELNLSKDVKEAKKYSGFPAFPKSDDNVKRLYKDVFAVYLD